MRPPRLIWKNPTVGLVIRFGISDISSAIETRGDDGRARIVSRSYDHHASGSAIGSRIRKAVEPLRAASRRIVACRRDLRQNQGSLDISLPRRRQGRKDRGFPPSRQARCRCRQSVFSSGIQEPSSIAAEDHARRLSSLASSCSRRSRTARLNNLIEQDHRTIKLRLGPMLGFKRFRHAAITNAGIELLHRIRKVQFALSKLRATAKAAPKIWSAALAA